MRSDADPVRRHRPQPLVASGDVTTAATAPEGAAPEAAPAASSSPPHPSRPGPNVAFGVILAAALTALAFTTTGGFDTIAAAGDTWSQIVIILLGACACAAAVLFGARGRAWGGVTVALFAALAALTALSIAWSVQPDHSWQSATQTFAYLAAFAGAAALARVVPDRWPAVVGAVATATVVLSGYALLVKVFPASLDAGDTLGRLQSPFGYWNADGVAAAMGIVPCLWAGSRRVPGRLLRTLAVPGLALLISVVILSFSRSSVLVAVVAAGCWFAAVPLRLRSAAILTVAGAGAAVIAGWALSTHALSADRVSLSARTSAGHTFGIVLLIAVLALAAAGFGCAVALDRARLAGRQRRRIGTALVVLVGLLPFVGIGALAVSSRGLTGEVSHYWGTLTSAGGYVGDNAGRLLQLSNSRPLYWSEGITVGEHALLAGVGAEGYATARTAYTTSPLSVSHAHSYAIETFADLGLIGLALNLALLVAWLIAAARPLAPRTPWRGLTAERSAERQGLIAIAIAVLAFGIQSAVDWTWFFSGIAIPALLCAGWLAGRGPLGSPVGRASAREPIVRRPGAAALVTGLVALLLIGGWFTWQPLRAADGLTASVNAAAGGKRAQAFTDAREAARIDPVSIEPLQLLSSLYAGAGDQAAARAELVDATRLQPRNPDPWQWLGLYDVQIGRLRPAYAELREALRLDITNQTTIGMLGNVRSSLRSLPPGP
jgi:hypothetical protein